MLLIWSSLNHKGRSICQGHIILRISHLQVVSMKVPINNNRTAKEPSKVYKNKYWLQHQYKKVILPIRMILPVIRKINLWLRTCRTEIGQIAIFWCLHSVAKAKPFPGLKITPLPWDTPKLPISILIYSSEHSIGQNKCRAYRNSMWKCIVCESTQFLHEAGSRSFAFHGINVEVVQDIKCEGSFWSKMAGWE